MRRNQFLYNLLNTLEVKKLDYSIIRGWEDIPNTMSGGDLDLAINPHQYELVKQTFAECAKKTNGVLVSFLDNNMCPKYTFLGEDWGLQIDVCLTPTNYRCREFLYPNFVFENTERFKGFNVMSLEADSYLAFFKEVLYNGYCQKQKYLDRFSEYIRTHNEAEIRKTLEVYSNNTITDLIRVVGEKKTDELKSISKKLRNDIVPIINVKYWRNQLKKIPRIFTHTGYTIAVLGTDGSGKSFIIDSLSPWLDEAFHNGISYTHLRPNVLPDLGVALKKRQGFEKGKEPKVIDQPHTGVRYGFLKSIVMWSYYLIDYTFGYMKNVWPKVSTKAKIYIFDRYYYDYYMDQARFKISLPIWILKIGDLFVPKPDLILCLGGDPEKIYARKPETSLAEVKRQTIVLRNICNKKKNTIWIDTTLSPEESIIAAKKAIIHIMSSRFRNVLK